MVVGFIFKKKVASLLNSNPKRINRNHSELPGEWDTCVKDWLLSFGI